jgi:hypothetical protein
MGDGRQCARVARRRICRSTCRKAAGPSGDRRCKHLEMRARDERPECKNGCESKHPHEAESAAARCRAARGIAHPRNSFSAPLPADQFEALAKYLQVIGVSGRRNASVNRPTSQSGEGARTLLCQPQRSCERQECPQTHQPAPEYPATRASRSSQEPRRRSRCRRR